VYIVRRRSNMEEWSVPAARHNASPSPGELLFSINSVPKPRMLSVRAVYILSSLQLRVQANRLVALSPEVSSIRGSWEWMIPGFRVWMPSFFPGSSGVVSAVGLVVLL
jgi:hypothetical protein